MASTIPVAVVLDALGRPLTEQTLGFLEAVIIAYLGVQGIIDWRKAKNHIQDISKEEEV